MAVNATTVNLEAVQKDVEEIQEDVEDIQEDVEEISEDVEEISEDVEEISEDVEDISEESNEPNTKLNSELESLLKRVASDIETIKSELRKNKEHRKMIEKTQAKPISEVLKGANEYSIVRIAGVIEQVKKIQTKKGDTMLFATVQDFSPEPLEVVVFSNTLSQNPQIWEVNTAVVIEGKISLRNGEKKFIAEKALKLA
jgi:DNA polymerase III alpha subunit